MFECKHDTSIFIVAVGSSHWLDGYYGNIFCSNLQNNFDQDVVRLLPLLRNVLKECCLLT